VRIVCVRARGERTDNDTLQHAHQGKLKHRHRRKVQAVCSVALNETKKKDRGVTMAFVAKKIHQ
jgi:hypothetical protein